MVAKRAPFVRTEPREVRFPDGATRNTQTEEVCLSRLSSSVCLLPISSVGQSVGLINPRPAVRARHWEAEIAQLGERQTEDLKVPCSIHGFGKRFGVCGVAPTDNTHQWFSGKMNGSHSFAPGSIPGWCIAPG